MNETLKTLEERRSIRAYRPEQISDEKLEQILRAGLYAPCGMGRQSAIMVAVQDPEIIARLSKLNAHFFGRDVDPFYGAPTVIAVLADPSVVTYVEDGAAVMCNLVNAAWSLGVDSCWVHRAREVFGTDEGKALLRAWGVPENYVGAGNCVLGYRACEVPEPKPRRDGRIVRVK